MAEGERVRSKKRMLIIVNPYATTVSDRLKNLVVYALQGRYEVEAVTTEAPEPRHRDRPRGPRRRLRHRRRLRRRRHPERGRQRAGRHRCAGLGAARAARPTSSAAPWGSPTTSSTRPSTCSRSPTTSGPRRIDLGIVDGRHFVFSCGVGIDATVVERVDAHPQLKARAGPYYYTWAAVSGFYRRYLRQPGPAAGRGERRPRARGGHRPGPELRPLHLLRQPPDPRLRGDRDRRRHALSRGADARHAARQADPDPAAAQRAGTGTATARSSTSTESPRRPSPRSPTDAEGGSRPFPVQVDGDYIGEHERVRIGVLPGALTVVA